MLARFCAVADELSDRIYMIAGGSNTNRRKLCRYYTVSSNSWGDCGSLQNKTIVSRYRHKRGSFNYLQFTTKACTRKFVIFVIYLIFISSTRLIKYKTYIGRTVQQ